MSNILYVQTSGLDTPERLYAPSVLAATASAMDTEASIFFIIKGITALRKGEAKKIKIGNFPTLKGAMDQAIKVGVNLYVCEQSTQLLGMSRGDLYPRPKLPEPEPLTI